MRKVVAYAWVAAVALAGIQLGWTWLARRTAPAPRPSIAQALRQEETGTAVRILQFYANTGELTVGQRAVVCYGVENAQSVHLQPPVEELKPAFNRCFEVTPERTTTYTLAAEGFDGTSMTASFQVRVKPAPASILFVALSGREVQRGQPLTVCYGMKNASEARLEPVGWKLVPSEKLCIKLFPVRTQRYTLTASGPGGMDRERFSVAVR